MTLQYRVRSMEEDRNWQQRIRLSCCLLLDAVDWWCRADADFPLDFTVASVLYLFSPRCNPFDLSEIGVRSSLLETVGTPTDEYSQTCPRRTDDQRSKLINTISSIVSGAIKRWDEGSFLDPPIEMVNQQIVDQLVAQQYVIFHHHETTQRDFGGFFGSW
jgi:hypothetical protein